MTPQIKQRIEQIRRGEVPEGYKKTKVGIVPADWQEHKLSHYLTVNNDKNTDLKYTKDDVFSISGELGIVNQIELLGRSYAGVSVAPYGIVYPNDVVYTKSPLKANPYGIIKTNKLGVTGIVSTLYAIFHCNNNVSPDYVQLYFESDHNLNNYLYPIVNIGAKHDMKISDEGSLRGTVVFPPLPEQEKIAAILQTEDKVIELQQKKIDELKRLKKVYLSKMFPKKGCNVPEIRFPGFTAPWEQRKFDEVFDCTVPNNTLSRAELSYDEGTVLNVHYGDVLIKYRSVLDVQKDDIPRIPHRCREDFNGALLQDGDVIIADTAEDETTGKACEIGNLQGSAIVSGLHTMVCRPRNRMALGYLGYYLNSNAYHHQLLPLMQGIKVLSLSRSNIQKTSVSYPIAVKEQQLIAYYFSQLDNLITLHQRKCDEEKQKKKALMQLLLTGIVRT